MKHIFIILLLFSIAAFSQSDYAKAQKLFESGQLSQARPLFENHLKQNPTHLKTIEFLGDIAFANKSWDKAIDYFATLKKLKPNEANFHFKYGGAVGLKAKESNKFKALGMIDEIRESFEKAIELNPKHIEARWALVQFNIQLPAIFGGSERKAINYSNELLKLSPVDGYLSRGQIEEHYKRYSAAEEQYKKAAALGSAKASELLANLPRNKVQKSTKNK